MATRSSKPKASGTAEPEPPAAKTPDPAPEAPGPVAAPTLNHPPDTTVVMTCISPMTVNARAVAAGDRVTTDYKTAARLFAHGYAAPTDDLEVN